MPEIDAVGQYLMSIFMNCMEPKPTTLDIFDANFHFKSSPEELKS